jgi:AcrR family transcriptional regulator
MGNLTPKGSRTKSLILEKSLGLFAAKGYKETSVRDIASSVGLQQGALYNHFENKDAILAALVERLMSSAIVTIFEDKEPGVLYKDGKKLLKNIASTFKLLSFDKQNEALFRLMMQEMYKNSNIRDLYHEYFCQHNIKKLSSAFFMMMQDDMIRSSDPLLLANEFLAPLFFYQTQVALLRMDQKSTSAAVTLFEKHVDFFWSSIKLDSATKSKDQPF